METDGDGRLPEASDVSVSLATLKKTFEQTSERLPNAALETRPRARRQAVKQGETTLKLRQRSTQHPHRRPEDGAEHERTAMEPEPNLFQHKSAGGNGRKPEKKLDRKFLPEVLDRPGRPGKGEREGGGRERGVVSEDQTEASTVSCGQEENGRPSHGPTPVGRGGGA